MYGYPEQFIPAPELVGYGAAPQYGGAPHDRRHHQGGHGMKKIEAYIRHEAFEPIRMELLDLGFPSLSISEVKGSGRQKGIVETYRGAEPDQLPAAEDQARVRGGGQGRADDRRHDPQARPHRRRR